MSNADINTPGDQSSNLESENLKVEKDPNAPGDKLRYPQKGDTVWVHYEGFLDNGTKFDSSRDRGSPFKTEIGLGKVIQGWDEGIPQLSVGERAKFTVPSKLAYKERGFPPVIPPNATLTFEVELLDIKVGKAD